MSLPDILYILLFTSTAAFGSYAYKLAGNRKGGMKRRIVTNWFIYAGVGLYLLENVFFTMALKGNDLSFILAFTGLTYVWSLAIARLLLKEKLNLRKLFGVSLIIVGVVIVTYGRTAAI